MTFLLEVAIGLVLVYTVLSMFCTAINEWIARWSNLRAKTLKVGINELLTDKTATSLAQAFHAHPLITGLCYKDRYAQYIPSKTFALAILDTAFKETSPGKYDVDAAKYPPAATATPAAKLPGDLLNAVVRGTGGDSEQIVARLSTWFDDSMDRVSGVYKRKTQVIIFFVALGLAMLFHVDTIGLVRRIQRDSVLRAALNAQATALVKQPRDSADWKVQMDKLEAAHLPLGWSCSPLPLLQDCKFDFTAAVGIFMTAIALALGAPFWFDTLNKLVNLRQTGVPPDEKDAKVSKKP